jgi:NADPH-dependent 2,4-dienoyl-CoA reductase/sulfur reductase-like enzyme
VVGAGPAGLECARVAAERGHQVSLYEREPEVGGQLRLAARPPLRSGFDDVLAAMKRAALSHGVALSVNTHVSADLVREIRPDHVVLATGAVPRPLYFPGLEDVRWILASELLDGSARLGTSSALVVGAGRKGLQTADYLAGLGVRITVVEMRERAGEGLEPLARAMLHERLRQRGAEIRTSERVVRFEEGFAIAKTASREVRIPFETVVLALGARPDRALLHALDRSGLALHVIGDASEPRRAQDAVLEGFELGRTLA